MYCRNCGKEINDSAVFCPDCGKPVNKNLSNQESQKTEKHELPKCVLV